MLNRLYLGIHWIVFLAFFGIWALFLLSLMIGSPDKVLDDYKQEYISKKYINKFHPEVKI